MSDTTFECAACRGELPRLTADETAGRLARLDGDWHVIKDHHLENVYPLRDFREALAFAHRIGEVAEAEGHHPELHVGWGRVGVTIWTHKIDGLTEADFTLAGKVEHVFRAAFQAADRHAC